MAGIGFALRHLASRDSISANLHGYGHAAFAACGPWLFTIVALSGIQLVLAGSVPRESLQRFAIVVIYNFAFSMVLAGPIVMVATRLLADMLYGADARNATGLLVAALLVLQGLLLLIGAPFYGLVVDMQPAERLVSLLGLLVIGSIWLAATFMTALKSYATVSTAFGLGMAIAFVAAAAFGPRWGAVGLQAGFTSGMAVTLFLLVGRIFIEYPTDADAPAASVRASMRSLVIGFKRYPELALAGFCYNAAIWVDKWILWFAPGHVVVAGAMHAHPVYDGAMFLAYLSILPSSVLTLVAVETRFHERYLHFYREIEGHATARRIDANHRSVSQTAYADFRVIAVLQVLMCYLAILVAPGLIGLARGGVEMVPTFRFAALGALFHALLIVVLVAISYFDLRRLLLGLTAMLLLTNAAFTSVTVTLGPDFFGYGYMLACAITLLVGCIATARNMARLPYLTFVRNNTALDG